MKGYKITKEILVSAFEKTKETSLLVCQDGHVFTKKHTSFCFSHCRLQGIKSQEVKSTEVDEFLKNNKFEETVAKKAETSAVPQKDKTEAKGTATDTPTIEELEKLQKEELLSKVNAKIAEKSLTEMSHKELVEIISIIDERASAPRSKAECIAIIEETLSSLKTV